MHKRAIALVLSMAIIHSNSYEVVSYAAEYIEEKTVQEVSIQQEDTLKQDNITNQFNIHIVHNTQELLQAINTAVEGDIIKIYDGEYTEESITVNTPGITIQGYTSTDEPVRNFENSIVTRLNLTINASNVNINGISIKDMCIGKTKAVEQVSIKNAYILNNMYIGQGKNGVANHTNVENTKVEKYMYVGNSYGVANNTTLKGVSIYFLEASGPYTGNADYTTLENCEIINVGRITGNNCKMINSNVNTLYLSGDNSTVESSDMAYLYLAKDNDATNITIKNTNMKGTLFIGQDDKLAKNIVVDNVVSKGAMIGYKGGISDNVTIKNSTMYDAICIGRSAKGKATNTQIYNTSMVGLFVGADTGTSENTKVLNSQISGPIHIGVSDGSAINTLVQTNSILVNNGGTNTTILNDILSNSTKLTGEAAKGMRIELIKDGQVYINKSIEENRKIDTYFKEDDHNFTFNVGEELNLKVYDDKDTLLFDEIITVKRNTVAPNIPKVNNIDNTSTSITGSAQPYIDIVAKVDNREIGKTKSQQDGSFEITLDNQIKEDTIVEVYAVDKDQNISNKVMITVDDVVKPDAPTVDEVTTKSKSITGKAEANSTVTVTLTRNSSKYNYQEMANDKGDYNIALDTMVRANDEISVYTQDKAGNKSDTISVNIKVVLPQKPIITKEISNASKYINGSAEPNSIIKAYINGELAMETSADNDGKFTIDIPWSDAYNIRIPSGTIIEFIAVDQDGDTSGKTAITVTDVRPNAVISINEFNNVTDVVRGRADADKEIIAFIDKTEVGRATSNANGDFKLELANNIEEDTVVQFIVAGENNIFSEIKSIKVEDVIAPIINQVNELNNKEQILTGKSEPGSVVVALREGQVESDSDVITAKVKADGQFEIQFSDLRKGEIVRVYAKDKAGNRSETLEVVVTNKLAPSLSVQMLQNIDTTIKGMTEANSNVIAVLKSLSETNNEEIGKTVADENGNFTINLDKKLNYNDKVIIKVVDVDQNITEQEITVDDITNPVFESIDKINNRTKILKGKVSEAGAKVKVEYYDNKGNLISELGEVEVDKDGNFKLQVTKKLRESDEVKFRVTDLAGNYTDKRVIVEYVKEFKDIESHWAKEEIYSFIEKGYISGYLDDTFRPNNQITRAEFVKIVNGVFGYTEKGDMKFTDVQEKDWYYNDVAIAVRAGYINGKSDKIFDPKAPITRQEAAKIIATIKNCADNDFDKIEMFNDKNTVANWSKSYVEGVIEAGYMGGYSDNTFRPNQKITRAEAVVTLQRTIK